MPRTEVVPAPRRDGEAGESTPPVLSVVIACLNAAETIGSQLDALAASPCPVPYEVIVADNGSTDGTREIVRAARGRFSAVRVVDAAGRRGVSHARNRGAAQARGRWLAFCDADDIVGSGWTAAMYAALQRARFVAGRFDGTLLNDPRTLRSRPLAQQNGLQTTTMGPGLPHAGAGNLGIERRLFEQVGGFDESLVCLEDTDLCWRVQMTGADLVWAPEAVIHMRLRSSLRGMFRQGRAYGRAHSTLESRYGRARDAARSAGVPPFGVAPLGVHPQAHRGATASSTRSWRADRSGALMSRPEHSAVLTRVRAAPEDGVTTPLHLAKTPSAGAEVQEESPAPMSIGRLTWLLGWHVGHRTATSPRGRRGR